MDREALFAKRFWNHRQHRLALNKNLGLTDSKNFLNDNMTTLLIANFTSLCRKCRNHALMHVRVTCERS